MRMRSTKKTLIALTGIFILLLSACAGNKKEQFINDVSSFIEDADYPISEKVSCYEDLSKWQNDDALNSELFKTIEQKLLLVEENNRVSKLLLVLDNAGYRSKALRENYQRVLIDNAEDLDSVFYYDEIAKESGWYGDSISFNIDQNMIDSFDTDGFTIDEIIELNDNLKALPSDYKKQVKKSNIDASVQSGSFEEKLDITKKLIDLGYVDPILIKKEDIDEFTREHSEKIYTENGEGGYYDDSSNRNIRSFNDEIMSDGDIRNTTSLEYFGDFAFTTYSIEYVDYDDNYKIKHRNGFDCYFKGIKLDAELEAFKGYKEYVLTPPYLLAASGDRIDVFNSETGALEITLTEFDALSESSSEMPNDQATGGSVYLGIDENGKKISWRVLDRQEGKMLIISETILAHRPFFYEFSKDINWTNSALREWLNNDFIDSMFSEEETKLIIESEIASATGYGSVASLDKIFLLSKEEAEIYFKDDSDRSAKSEDVRESWLLRDVRGNHGDKWKTLQMNYVKDDGEIISYPIHEGEEKGIRPVLWISV